MDLFVIIVIGAAIIQIGHTTDDAVVHQRRQAAGGQFSFGGAVESLPGILRTASSPLTTSAQVLDQGISFMINSAGGLIPNPLRLSLPGSISRGTEASIGSPTYLASYFTSGVTEILTGGLGLVTSPLKLSGTIGTIKLPNDIRHILPVISNNPIVAALGDFILLPALSVNALSAQAGQISSGILKVLASPLAVSGNIFQASIDTDVISPPVHPTRSNIGAPDSLTRGVDAVVNSPINLSGAMSDSTYLLVTGLIGLLASPWAALSGGLPMAISGSAQQGTATTPNSFYQLTDLAYENLGMTLAGLTGFASLPVTVGGRLIRLGFDINPWSPIGLFKELRLFNIPESVALFIAEIIKIPNDVIYLLRAAIGAPFKLVSDTSGVLIPGSPNRQFIFPPTFPDQLPEPNIILRHPFGNDGFPPKCIVKNGVLGSGYVDLCWPNEQ